MKAINEKFAPIIGKSDKLDVIRKGKAGADGELFTDEHLAKIDDFCKSELARLNSDFPYEVFAGG